MRELVTIQSETRGNDGLGGAPVVWTDGDTVAAEVSPLTGTQQVLAMQQVESQTYNVIIRYRTDVTYQNQLSWNGKILQILGVSNPDEKRRFLQIYCQEKKIT